MRAVGWNSSLKNGNRTKHSLSLTSTRQSKLRTSLDTVVKLFLRNFFDILRSIGLGIENLKSSEFDMKLSRVRHTFLIFQVMD